MQLQKSSEELITQLEMNLNVAQYHKLREIKLS